MPEDMAANGSDESPVAGSCCLRFELSPIAAVDDASESIEQPWCPSYEQDHVEMRRRLAWLVKFGFQRQR